MSSVNRWTKKLLWIWLGTMVNDISLAHISYRSVEQNKTPDISELRSYIGQITVVRANVHKQPLIWVPQILNAQLEAFWIWWICRVFFFWYPNPRISQNWTSEYKSSDRNSQFLTVMFLRHILAILSYGHYVLKQGNSFFLCQRKTQETRP